MMKGANQKIAKGRTAEFTFNVTMQDFQRALVDRKEISSGNYTIKEENGNTVVILKEEYLNTLRAGTHTISIVSAAGEAEAEFTISDASADTEKAPKTGDSTTIALWMALMAAAAGGIAGIVIYKRKRIVRERNS